MAIDSQEKRASASNDGMPWDWGGSFPDGVMTAADRMDTTQTYRGILAIVAATGRRMKTWWWTS